MDVSVIFLILVLSGLALKIYMDSDFFQLKCIISTVDGKKYCIRDRMRMQEAADRLAECTNNMEKLVRYCGETHPQDARVQRLVKGFNPKRIQETLPTSTLTAYSENKGEKIAFCLERYKNGGGGLIDLNTLTFVAIHELAHVATAGVGHTPEFWSNFKFLIGEAKNCGVYRPVDYKAQPQQYCGMEISDSPYFE